MNGERGRQDLKSARMPLSTPKVQVSRCFARQSKDRLQEPEAVAKAAGSKQNTNVVLPFVDNIGHGVACRKISSSNNSRNTSSNTAVVYEVPGSK